MTTGKQAHLESARGVKAELMTLLEGMDYCLDWKQDSAEWSPRELVYHVLDTPPGGLPSLVKGILSGEVREYDLWSDLTNVTPERAGYDMIQVTADIESFFQGLDGALSGASDEDLETKTVMLHQKSRGFDEARTLTAILQRTLDGHMRDHLTQLRELRDALGL